MVNFRHPGENTIQNRVEKDLIGEWNELGSLDDASYPGFFPGEAKLIEELKVELENSSITPEMAKKISKTLVYVDRKLSLSSNQAVVYQVSKLDNGNLVARFLIGRFPLDRH